MMWAGCHTIYSAEVLTVGTVLWFVQYEQYVSLLSGLPSAVADAQDTEMLSPPPQKDRSFVLHHWMAEARRLHAEGTLDQAANYYAAILRAQPTNIDAKHLLGVLRMQQGKFAQAVRLFLQVRVAAEPSALLEVNIGDALRLSGKVQAALAHYDAALAVDPANSSAHVNRGIGLQQLGRQEAALAAFSDALHLNSAPIEARNNRGSIYQEMGLFDKALVDFDAALDLDPDNIASLYNKANCLKAAGRLLEARGVYLRLLECAPDHFDGLNNLGNLFRELGEPQEALDCFDRALALQPNHVAALNNRGTALRDVGRSLEAIASYSRALEQQPDFAIAHNNAGDMLSELGRFEEADAALRRAIDINANYSQPYLNLSAIHRFVPGDPLITAMERSRARALVQADRARFDFALGKASADLGAYEDAFRYYAEGAAIRRHLQPYDEIATMALMSGLKAVFTPEFVACRRGGGNPDLRPIFILGMPRSGTSLIEQILASHPAVHGGGELKALSRAMRPLQARDGVFPLNLSDIAAEDLTSFADRYAAEVAAYVPTELRVTDKMPLNFYFVGLIMLAMPNARIIHATRNPVDTCLSCFMQHFAEGHEFTNDLAELGRYWRAYADLMAHWRTVLGPDTFLDVAYEDVVADMEGETRRMLDYLGLDWDDRCLSFYKSDRAVRTASVAQVRQPIYKTSVERWRVYEPWIGPLIEALD